MVQLIFYFIRFVICFFLQVDIHQHQRNTVQGDSPNLTMKVLDTLSLVAFLFLCQEMGATLSPQCRIHWIAHRIVLPNCIEKRLLSLACKGQCQSYTQYSSELRDIEHVCKCCQPTGKSIRRIRMTCRNMSSMQFEMRIVQVALPIGCMCRPCSSSLGRVPDVVNPVEGGGPPLMDMLTSSN